MDTSQPWDAKNYYELDKATCQKYMDKDKGYKLPAYQAGTYDPVTYTPVLDGSSYWPSVAYGPKAVNQCESVLSIDAWKATP